MKQGLTASVWIFFFFEKRARIKDTFTKKVLLKTLFIADKNTALLALAYVQNT
jgi:hypothetical protein